MNDTMYRLKLLTIVALVVVSTGCVANSNSIAEPTSTATDVAADSSSNSQLNNEVFTESLRDRVREYNRYNQTGGIRVIVAFENKTNKKQFNQSVEEIEQAATVRHTFRQERLVAATATPEQLQTLANISSVETIGHDRDVSAD
jgi:hypothetical protein